MSTHVTIIYTDMYTKKKKKTWQKESKWCNLDEYKCYVLLMNVRVCKQLF